MALRITHQGMYGTLSTNMSNSLAAYMVSNEQASSGKQINRPSDDAVGITRILNYRTSLALNVQYQTNSQDAYTWLSSTDSALTQSQVILSTIKEKAEQAATGTMTAENRKQIAEEITQLFNQLINLANTSYTGQYLFSGHQNTSTAYQVGMGITTTDTNLSSATTNSGDTLSTPWTLSGSSDSTVMVRFTGVNGVSTGGTTGEIGVDTIDYSYSTDGGATWITKTLNPGESSLDLDGVTVDFLTAGANPGDLSSNLTITCCDQDDAITRDNGTVLFVRPTAYYQGDTLDNPPQVDAYGSALLTSLSASGSFSSDVRVRLDSDVDTSVDGQVQYSYSTDNGITWTSATADTHAGASVLRLTVPGGYIDVEPSSGTMESGQQFVVRPSRADVGYEINQGEYLSTLNCGKDIFGGLYVKNGDTVASAEGGDSNIFEVISDLIAYCENNIQDGCQEALESLNTAMEVLLTNIARVGGKMNRVSLNITMLESLHDDQTSRMSTIEDVDFTALLTKLTQQQLTYQTVLQSASMIMNLNLTNFL